MLTELWLTIGMKISHKLLLSFVSISLLTSVVGVVAIAQSKKIAETLAIKEAEEVAQVLATSIVHHSATHGESIFSNELQTYVLQLHHLQRRDIEVVNRETRIVADVVPDDIGTILEGKQGKEVQKTIQDGQTRTLLENSDDYPQGIELIVVPLKRDQNQIDGAVILEWSSLYEEAIAQVQPTIIIIAITSLSCVILALTLGWQISSSIAKPLQSMTDVAQTVTQKSNFDLKVPIITKDETGLLAIAFNHLIERVKTLLAEKEQRSEELQQALSDLHNTQLQLVQTEKMSSLGQLVAGVAHEINNPVNFIYGNIIHIDKYTQDLLKLLQAYQYQYPNPPQTLQKILDDIELDFLYEDLSKLLQSMRVGTQRIRQIVLSLRNFSRLDEAECKAVDLHEGLDNTLLILQHRLKDTSESFAIEVIKNYGQLPLVECYPAQLNQVFMNVLLNAIDAVEESAQQQTTAKLWISTQLIADNQVQILIADNGTGIPEKMRSRIFEPFFTTKPTGKGTGLGLSISYKIITEKHHGKMWFESRLGEGSEFIIAIPVHQCEISG
ncbi:ATPase [Nostoc sp. CENA543]|uniref:sensor histidine kinase n=1 Tax=Nostoc sp. CENA543 TaxID=1869241 RepID=UPI000CA3A046|nr:ATP-binding protein [Nostoc sp. CENA543]AUT02747.1 ATPase [Nostoc sp. CENA543]